MRSIVSPLDGFPSPFGPRTGASDPILAVSGLARYYRAERVSSLAQLSDGSTPVSSDGDPVGSWGDIDGTPQDATQATASFRPAYKTAGGLHWVRSDGLEDRLDFSAVTARFLAVACRRNSEGAGPTAYVIGGNNQGISNGGNNSSFDDILAFDGTNIIHSGVDDQNAHVITVNITGSSGVLRVDGAEFTGTLNPIEVSRLFNRSDGTFRFDGDIFAAAIATDAQTTNQVAAAEQELAALSGVTLP